MDPSTITILGGITLSVIAALAAAVVSVINALRISDVREKQTRDAALIDTVARDTETIKGHVNSEKTAAEGREITLRSENQLLREIIADKKNAASLLAQATATRTRQTATHNTAATSENTENTAAQPQPKESNK